MNNKELTLAAPSGYVRLRLREGLPSMTSHTTSSGKSFRRQSAYVPTGITRASVRTNHGTNQKPFLPRRGTFTRA